MSYSSQMHFSSEIPKSKTENPAESTATSFSLSTFSSDAIWHIFVLAFMTNVNHSYITVSLRLAKQLWLS